MAQRPGFMFYLDWEGPMMALPDKELRKLLQAMISYTKTGQEPQFSHQMTAALWDMYRTRLDADGRRYEKMVQQRQAAVNRRWERERAESQAPRADSAARKARGTDGMDKYLDW